MFRTSDVSIVIQGQLPQDEAGMKSVTKNILMTRHALPGATVILSTWHGTHVQVRQFPVDIIVRSDDPGPLPHFKYGKPHVANNVNRQIVSTAAGLAIVKTPYALKLRTDCRIETPAILDLFRAFGRNPNGSDRIVVPHLFSVDPRVFEQMPFHLSDWLQFGPTEKLQALWAAPLMSEANASYYDTHTHALWSSRFDLKYRARFAAEQHIWCHYARALGYACPDFHNDISPHVLEAHDRFVTCETLVMDTALSGLAFDRYGWALKSGLQKFNCISGNDWFELIDAGGHTRPASRKVQKSRRTRAKHFLKMLARQSETIAPALQTWPIKPVVSYFLKTTHAWSAASIRKQPSLTSSSRL